MRASDGPPAAVLAAFGATGVAARLPGGQGGTWRVGDLILKPCAEPAEAAWIGEVLQSVPPSRRFRLAAPVRARGGGWVAHGWQAWLRVHGEPDERRWYDVLRVGEAFHEAIAGLARPAFLDARDDAWSYGDRVAWQELPVAEDGVMGAELARLARARRPVPLPAQVVHGDLLGNVLFADGLPPAIIDWAVYFRPALWSLAVAVVDALAWSGAPDEVVDARADRPGWHQMLVRALMYRMATNEGFRRHGRPHRERAEVYLGTIALVLGRADR